LQEVGFYSLASRKGITSLKSWKEIWDEGVDDQGDEKNDENDMNAEARRGFSGRLATPARLVP
jgi:hypothetical protein